MTSKPSINHGILIIISLFLLWPGLCGLFFTTSSMPDLARVIVGQRPRQELIGVVWVFSIPCLLFGLGSYIIFQKIIKNSDDLKLINLAIYLHHFISAGFAIYFTRQLLYNWTGSLNLTIFVILLFCGTYLFILFQLLNKKKALRENH